MNELAAELQLERVLLGLRAPAEQDAGAAHAAGMPAPSIARAVRQAAAFAALRPRVLDLVRGHAPALIDRLAEVIAARQAPPSRAAYCRLRAAQDAGALAAFATSWSQLTCWHIGAPQAPLPAPCPLPPAEEAFTLAREPSWPWQHLVDSLLPAPLQGKVWVVATDSRPVTRIVDDRAAVFVRTAQTSPRGCFELAHELGHAVAWLLHRRPLPRAVDEAAAAWMARHLEEPALWPALGGASLSGGAELQARQRLRRTALAVALAHTEQHPELADTLLGAAVGSGVPWALWHDGGAQVAYLHAEQLAAQWWELGLRWVPPWDAAMASLTTALAQACRAAAALPAPLPW